MRKLLLAVAGLLVLAMSGLMGFTLLFNHSKSDSEPYAVSQARAQAEIAKLQQDQAAGQFWFTFFQVVAVVLFVLLVAALVTALVMWFRGQSIKQNLQVETFRRSLNVFEADANGNYPAIRMGQELITTNPGNTAYPPVFNFVHGQPPQPVKAPRRENDDRSLVINSPYAVSNTGTVTVKPVELEQLAAPSPERVPPATESVQGEIEVKAEVSPQKDDFTEILEGENLSIMQELALAKSKGDGMVEAIERITGVKPGKSKQYQTYRAAWKNL